MEDNSARKIQKWWRAKLEKDHTIADKACQVAESRYLSQITLQNNQLISKLEKLRKQKTRDTMRYERILNMPARDVNNFMKNEISREIGKNSELGEEHDSEKQHAAAVMIQKSFRNYCKAKIAAKYLKSMSNINPNKRVEYLVHINEKLSNKKTINVIPLEEVRAKLHHRNIQSMQDAQNFARRQELIREIKHASLSTAMTSLELIKTANLNVSTPLINYRAQQMHAEEMEKIEEMKWKFC